MGTKRLFFYYFFLDIRSNISTTIWYPIQFAVDSLDRRQEDNKKFFKKCRLSFWTSMAAVLDGGH